jgi:excisionase family DNA binding protein
MARVTTGREFVAHLAAALSAHSKELRREGRGVPEEVDSLAALLIDCVKARQDATEVGGFVRPDDSQNVDTALVYTKREAASSLRISVRQLERLIAAGDLSAVRIGGAIRIRRGDLNAYVASARPTVRDAL